MKRIVRKSVLLVLCLAMVLGVFGGISVGATNTAAIGDKYIYANGEAVTYVPQGYTYVFKSESGKTYTRTAEQNMYISGRILSSAEAKALSEIEQSGDESYISTDDGKTFVCKTFDAGKAAAYSDAVKEILNGTDLGEGDEITLLAEAYSRDEKVRVMITFDSPAVSQMPNMDVKLGGSLSSKENTAMRTLKIEQTSIMGKVEKAIGYEADISGQFTLLTNAVSATVRYGDMAEIAKVAGVKNVFLMPTYEMPEINAQTFSGTELETNLKYAAAGMGADAAWNVGYKGEGMSVAVIDTGLCFENPAFEIEPSDSEGVAYSKAAIESILQSKLLHAEEMDETTAIDTVYYSSKIPFGFNYADGVANFGSDDDTRMGHGSHVAGIVAGNLPEEYQEEFEMTTMGLAPEAQLIIMKVFDQMGNCYFDYLIAAIEDTILLGVDCANLSLGAPSGPVYYEDVTEVYDAAYEAGINVVVSAGNDAHSGVGSMWGNDMVKSTSVSTGTVGMPGTFDSVLSVASAENVSLPSFYGNALSWYNSGAGTWQYMGYQEIEDIPEGKGFKENLQTAADLSGGIYEFTDSLTDAEGKLVCYAFEGGNADALVREAAAAKAAGLVLYDATPENEDEEWDAVAATLTTYDVPVARVALSEYEWMLENNPGTSLRVDAFWNASSLAGEMSSFSSWGPTDGLTLKPEITGIGGNVFSAYYGEYFAVASGTSMSSPAVAAGAALLRQYLKTTEITGDYNDVTNALLMSTATPIVDENTGTFYYVRRQGAGMANFGNAIASEAYITVEGNSKPKFELGDDPEKIGEYEMTFSVVNFSEVAKTYTLDLTALGQTAQGGQYKNGVVTYLVDADASELGATYTSTLSDGTLTVPAGTTAEVTVTLTLTEAQKAYYDERFPCGAYVEGFIQLLSDETPSLCVPFLAFYGDFGAAPVAEESNYETTLSGTKSYFTADQVTTSLSGSRAILENPALDFIAETAYLGDTDAPNYDVVPADEFVYATMWMNSKPFYSEHAGISPNSDGTLDYFSMKIGLRRNAENIHYTVTDIATGEILSEQDTGFMQKSYANDVYAGPEFDLSWLYEEIVEDFGDGELYTFLDYSKCKLEENTWVSVKAEITPEYAGAQKQVVEFTVYIDLSGPSNTPMSISTDYDEWSEMDMYSFNIYNDEYWYCDYEHTISMDVNPDTGTLDAFCMTGTYVPTAEPQGGMDGYSTFGTSYFAEDSKIIYLGYDYAGNCSAYEVSGSELAENIVLKADKELLYVGETLTIENIGETSYDTSLSWEVSDPALAEIVESSATSATIKALAVGKVSITAGIGAYKAAVDVTITDEKYEALKSKFTDMEGHWAKDDVVMAAYRGLFNGVSGTLFAPEDAITRGQVVAVLYRMEGSPAAATAAAFTDVPATAYYAAAINWAAEKGIVKGVSADAFAPEDAITREQLAAILYRYAQYAELDVSATTELDAYTDADAISAYAVDAVTWAIATGLIQGTSTTTIEPSGMATRAQAAVILIRFLNANPIT